MSAAASNASPLSSGAARPYRLLVADLDGRGEVTLKLACANDAEALRAALESLADLPMELWQGERLVASIEAAACATQAECKAAAYCHKRERCGRHSR